MMAVGKPEFFPDPAAASISVASLASCPLIVYRRWEPFISHCFPGTAPDYLCINDDARTSMTWAQCGPVSYTHLPLRTIADRANRSKDC